MHCNGFAHLDGGVRDRQEPGRTFRLVGYEDYLTWVL